MKRSTGMKVETFWLTRKNEDMLERDRNFALQQVSYRVIRLLLQGDLSGRESSNLSLREESDKTSPLIGRGFVFIHPALQKRVM